MHLYNRISYLQNCVTFHNICACVITVRVANTTMFLLIVTSVVLTAWTMTVSCDYQVTIYPIYLSQGGRSHYEVKRWNGHNVLDQPSAVPKLKTFGTKSARWINMDVSFKGVTQDPHHHGYPDPNYFHSSSHFQGNFDKYFGDYLGYNNDTMMVVETKGIYWPSWLDRSKYHGKFPNNMDAASEFFVLFLRALQRYTKGVVPKYFEVFNEPGSLWQDIPWQTVIDYHVIVAKKLKANFPGMQVGGPTRNGVASDKNNFHAWWLTQRFMDMSLDKLDFFSFHKYITFHGQGNSHRWSGASESRIVAFIDMVENYAHKKRGKDVPLIISEFGQASQQGIDNHWPNPYLDWAHIYAHNSQLFTYLNFRAVINQAIGFIVQYSTWNGDSSKHYSLLTKDGREANAAKAYKFWKELNYDYQFLYLDSPFDKNERMISSHAMANAKTGNIVVLLHNYDISHSKRVKLIFNKNWAVPHTVSATCLTLSSHKEPVLSTANVQVSNGYVTVQPEASCIYKFHSGFHFNSITTVKETTHYGQDMIKKIKLDCAICIFSCVSCSNAVSTHVDISPKGSVQYARLRIGVSLPGGNGGNPTPKTVLLNNHPLSSYYQLHQTSRGYDSSRWEVYEYSVPLNNLHTQNEVKIEFYQASGYVSTVALIVGRN